MCAASDGRSQSRARDVLGQGRYLRSSERGELSDEREAQAVTAREWQHWLPSRGGSARRTIERRRRVMSAHEMCREPAYDRHTRCVEHSRWMAQAWMGHGWDNPSAEVGGSGSRESERRTRCVAVRHDRGVVLEVMSCTGWVQKNKGEGMDACASSSRLPHQDRPSPRPRGGSSFPGSEWAAP